MDVRAQMLVFSKLLARDVRTNDPGTSAEYPAKNFVFGLFFVPELLNST